MVSYPNQNMMVHGIVVGGNDSDPDPTQSGGVRVYIPSEYGKGVDIKHLPFSRLMAQGTQEGITRFNPPPEHGAAVLCMKMAGHSGSGHLMVMGSIPNDINNDNSIPGNSSIWPAVEKAIKDTAQIFIPNNVGSGPAGSKPPKEKGKFHSQEIMKGIPSTATLWPMVGIPIPQMTNVTTATQAFSSILTADLLGKMPGMNMTLGSLIQNLQGTLLNSVLSKIPPEVGNALNAMGTLMQSMEIVEQGGFNTATKVNPDVFLQNAANLLSEATTIYDMVSAFQRLQHDTSLYGLDKLPSVTFEIDTPFGKMPMALDPLGNITSNAPQAVQQAIGLFSSLMQNGNQFPGVFPGANMFGQSSAVLNNMFNRLPQAELQKAVTQMQKNVAAGTNPRKAVNTMHKFATSAEKLGKAALKKLG